MRSRAYGPACAPLLQRRVDDVAERQNLHLIGQAGNSTRWSTRRCGNSRRSRSRPRMRANGSMTVSIPIFTARIDRNRFRTLDRHAGQHQVAHRPLAEDAIHCRQFHPGVDAEQFAGIGNHVRLDRVPGANQDLHHVGQVVFVGRIIGLDLARVLPEKVGVEAVDPGVDLAAPAAVPAFAAFCSTIACTLPCGIANHAAIAGGIVEPASRSASPAAPRRGLFRDQARRWSPCGPADNRRSRSPAAHRARELFAAAEHGVSRTLLLGLWMKPTPRPPTACCTCSA